MKHQALMIAAESLIDMAIGLLRRAKPEGYKEDVEYLRKAKSFINIAIGESKK